MTALATLKCGRVVSGDHLTAQVKTWCGICGAASWHVSRLQRVRAAHSPTLTENQPHLRGKDRREALG